MSEPAPEERQAAEFSPAYQIVLISTIMGPILACVLLVVLAPALAFGREYELRDLWRLVLSCAFFGAIPACVGGVLFVWLRRFWGQTYVTAAVSGLVGFFFIPFGPLHGIVLSLFSGGEVMWGGMALLLFVFAFQAPKFGVLPAVLTFFVANMVFGVKVVRVRK